LKNEFFVRIKYVEQNNHIIFQDKTLQTLIYVKDKMFIFTENEARHVFADNMKAGSIFTTAIYQQVDPSERNIAMNFDPI
jgi:hypothetical protein